MKFSIFNSAKSQSGRLCTWNEYLTYAESDRVRRICADVRAEPDAHKRGALKAQLPVITWQAEFEGRRLNRNAKPSGLFMLDIDHIENPRKLYSEKMCHPLWKTEHGVLFVGITASGHGLRLVARCRKEFSTIDQCQKWLSSELGVEYDSSCKDFARCSYLVSSDLTLYMNAGAIWQLEAEEGTIYTNTDFVADLPANKEKKKKEEKSAVQEIDQREGLFGGISEYRGIPLETIASEWLEYTGGIPEEGERNARLFKLATRMRYICDFNSATVARCIPDCGLPKEEVAALARSACQTQRAADMPRDLKEVIERIMKRRNLTGEPATESDEDPIGDTSKLPPLPPIIKQWAQIAPVDFRPAVVLCQLPILGALGSRLRSRYIDGVVHSPSFMVSLEAPQASGKSFMQRLVNSELAQVMERDEMQRKKEQEYDAKAREMKLLNVKVTADNKAEVLGSRPKSLIRIVPPTISVTKLLMRMEQAQGLHLFCFCPEADTMTKAFKRGFSSFSDLLRLSFDNDRAGQDYATDTSFSGVVRMYYNLLLSGTPKAMRRFYPDVEDGLISRVCFVTLPDQFGKPMPIWRTMDEKAKKICDVNLVRLDEVSMLGDDVQPEHEMKLEWLNESLKKWILMQQAEALRQDDRTRDIFCRRAAVVGFRAGMLAWFLYAEKNTPTIRNNVMRFAEWVANMMLTQHLLRFNVKGTGSNVNKWETAYAMLKDNFTRDELTTALRATGSESPTRAVVYQWKLLGIIKAIEEGRDAASGQRLKTKFKKIKR